MPKPPDIDETPALDRKIKALESHIMKLEERIDALESECGELRGEIKAPDRHMDYPYK